jgi:hypothetical protein
MPSYEFCSWHQRKFANEGFFYSRFLSVGFTFYCIIQANLSLVVSPISWNNNFRLPHFLL